MNYFIKKTQHLKCYLAKPKLLSRPTLVWFYLGSRMGTRPVSLQDYLGRAEEVLSVVGRGFGLRFFLKRDGFSLRSWRGPVGVPCTTHTLHRTRDSRRRHGWLGPVGDCRFCSGRGRMEHARYRCWCSMVVMTGGLPTYNTWTLIVPGFNSAFRERACLGVGCRRQFLRTDVTLRFRAQLRRQIVGISAYGRLSRG